MTTTKRRTTKQSAAQPPTTDPRFQPGACVKTPGGLRAYVLGSASEPGKVRIEYEAQHMGANTIPYHLLTLVQAAPEPAPNQKQVSLDMEPIAVPEPQPAPAFEVDQRVELHWEGEPPETLITEDFGQIGIITDRRATRSGDRCHRYQIELEDGDYLWASEENLRLAPTPELPEIGAIVDYQGATWEVRAIDGQHATINRETDAGVTSSLVKLEKLTPVEIVAITPTAIAASPAEQLSYWKSEIDGAIDDREAADRRLWIAIYEIHRRNLWQQTGAETFEIFCLKTWGWEKSNTWEVLSAGRETVALIDSGVPESDLPTSIAQIRPLKKLAVEQKIAAIQTAKQEHGKLTAAAIRSAVTAQAQAPETFRPIPPRACWFEYCGQWQEGQAIATDRRGWVRVTWGENSESLIPAANLHWEQPREFVTPSLPDSRDTGNSSGNTLDSSEPLEVYQPASDAETIQQGPGKLTYEQIKEISDRAARSLVVDLQLLGFTPEQLKFLEPGLDCEISSAIEDWAEDNGFVYNMFIHQEEESQNSDRDEMPF